jgi:hypothetical protein
MYFVNNINPVFSCCGGKSYFFPEIPDLVNSTVRSGVYFNNIHRNSSADFPAVYAMITGLSGFPGTAVKGFAQYFGGGGFTCSSGAAKKVGMADPPCCQSVLQRLCNMFLSNDLLEELRPPFPVKGKIRHF